MRATARIFALSILLACLWAPAAAAAPAKVVKRPVTFEVVNVNRSLLPCASDGGAYQVKGLLVGPAGGPAPGDAGEARSVTLYLHGFTVGRAFWSFGAVPRYDYAAAMARAGHTSLVVDRLGYGGSGRPPGDRTCLGADADVAHQVVGKLRTGDYLVESGEPSRFARVALAGHGVGGLIANLEAFSFGDVDALLAMSYTPQVTRQAFEQFYASRVVCNAGGEPPEGAEPAGYVHFGTAAEFGRHFFHNAEPQVRQAAGPLRVRDPCGAGGSIIDALVRDLRSLALVRVPVLVVCGEEDTMIPSFACPVLKRRYVGSDDVTLRIVRTAGYALTLERTAPVFRRRVGSWLQAHGF